MLTDKQRQKLIDRLAAEPSDSRLADKFGISRTTVRRIRQEELAKQERVKRAKPHLKEESKMPKPVVKEQAVQMAVAVEAAPPPAPPAPPAPVVEPPATVDPTPKVDAEPVTLGTYFAVQLLRGEHIKDVANAIMREAEARGALFRKLQVMDFLTVGTSSFVRFRSDLASPAAVLSGLNRGFIAFSDGNYRFSFSDGRQGVKFPTTIMCSVAQVGFGQTFAGPKIKRWAQQFATAS